MFRVNSTLESRRGKIARIYEDSYPDYYRAGWDGILPVDGKVLPRGLVGYTGHKGRDPHEAEVMDWGRSWFGRLNVALRLPSNVLGLDVDGYEGRAGATTLRALSEELGALPVTYRSTSRAPEDELSGIYLFRVPELRPGQRWRANLGQESGIDIVQRSHRYVVAPPSLHPETRQHYAWWRGDRLAVRYPNPERLPILPRDWVRYLLSSREAAVPVELASNKKTREWYRNSAHGQVCPLMREAAQSAAARIHQADRRGGLHETMRDVVWNLTHYAAEGHTGLDDALRRVKNRYMDSSRRRNLSGEWERALGNAKAHAAAVEQCPVDPCDEIGIGGFSVVR